MADLDDRLREAPARSNEQATSLAELSARFHQLTLLTDPLSIMAIGLRFMAFKVMERVPVLDWKVGWEVSLILLCSTIKRNSRLRWVLNF